MSGRDEQLGRQRDSADSRQEVAKEAGRDHEAEGSTPQPDRRPPGEEQAEADLLKTSGGDPFTQESD